MNTWIIKQISLLTLVLSFLAFGCTGANQFDEDMDLEMTEETLQKVLEPEQLSPEQNETSQNESGVQDEEMTGQETEEEEPKKELSIQDYKLKILIKIKPEEELIILE